MTRCCTTIFCLLSASLLAACSPPPAASAPEPETVVLLHGMGRTRVSLLVLEKRLQRAGYRTLNFPYSARDGSLDQLSDSLRQYVADNVKTKRYHFIAHSLGNIIIRNGFREPYRPGLGRIIMLAPPNHPADLAQRLKDNPVYQWLNSATADRNSRPVSSIATSRRPPSNSA